MLAAIDFDDEVPSPTYKIAEIAADRLLPHEFVPVELAVAEAIPQHRLGIGLVGAQLARPDGPLDRATHCQAAHPDRYTIRLSP